MPRLVHKKPGKRINIWLDNDSLVVAGQIDNLSNFFQMALKQASGIIAMDIIIKQQNLPQMPAVKPDDLARFNARHPLDPLTQKRKQKETWQTPSPLERELW